jgi:ferritin-like metal-binding protein YciE
MAGHNAQPCFFIPQKNVMCANPLPLGSVTLLTSITDQRRSGMSITSLQELFSDELADIYNAEKQLTEALADMAENAKDEKLASGFETHLKETRGQVERIEKVIEMCGLDLPDETCEAMKGLIEEAQQMIDEIEDDEVLDAALITAAQKVEHYEIASYGSLLALGKCLGIEEEALSLLEQNLEEEKSTNDKLTTMAEDEGINERAMKDAA